jgi:hypothetical protein
MGSKNISLFRLFILILGLAGTVFFPTQGLAKIGTLRGTVTSLGYCDMAPHPLFRADLVIQSSTSRSDIRTSSNGEYLLKLEASESPFSITVSALEHAPGSVTGIILLGDATTTVNFDLRWLKPCVTADPAELNVTLKWGEDIMLPLTIFSLGAAGSTWEVSEQPAAGLAWLSESPVSGILPADIGKQVLDIGFTSSLVPGPGEYLGWLHLSSSDPVNPIREIPVRLSVISYGVALSPPSLSGWGAAGERVEYLVQLTNEGSVADAFTLTSNGSPWVVDLTPTLAGLDPGKNLPVTVGVTIPGGTTPGVFNILEVTARSQGDPAKVSAVLLNTLAAYHLFLPLISR